MGFLDTNIILPTTLSLFCLPKKGLSRSRKLTGRDPMLPPAIQPARPSLGKEASALFFWLVLRTAPYELIMSILQMYKPIVNV